MFPSSYPAALFRRVCVLAVLLVCTAKAGEAVPAGWKLVWQDEFDRPQLDPTKWQRCARGSADWDRMMSKDPSLVELKDGLLRLDGVGNDDRQSGRSPFLTGGVKSQGKFEFLHGRVEVRARFKSARGAWPAIWLLAAGVQWPAGGEIDLMEHLNFDEFVHQTIHTPYTVDAKNTKHPDDNSRTAAIRRDEFNTYGVEWDDEQIVFLVNGERTFQYERDARKGPTQWPFSHPLYLILSMQIGGRWVGEPNPAHYPAYMEIDWVRVYRRE